MALRATYGSSFKAPQFVQTLGGVGGTYATLTAAQDPLATGGSTGALLLLGANPALKPETAESWTAGATFKPTRIPGLSLEATYFSIDFKDRIGAPDSVLQAIAAPQNYVGLLIRSPTPAQQAFYLSLPTSFTGAPPASGLELIFDQRLTNLAQVRVHGVDASLAYARATALGDWTAQLGASYLIDFNRQTNAASLATNVVDTIANPVGLRAHAGLGWSDSLWRASVGVSYADSYLDNVSRPARRIGSFTTLDARVSHSWSDTAGPPLRGVEIALSAINLTDAAPPFVNSSLGIGFDSSNASPEGRVISLELNRRW